MDWFCWRTKKTVKARDIIIRRDVKITNTLAAKCSDRNLLSGNNLILSPYVTAQILKLKIKCPKAVLFIEKTKKLTHVKDSAQTVKPEF
jgi:hypothetical protein